MIIARGVVFVCVITTHPIAEDCVKPEMDKRIAAEGPAEQSAGRKSRRGLEKLDLLVGAETLIEVSAVNLIT